MAEYFGGKLEGLKTYFKADQQNQIKNKRFNTFDDKIIGSGLGFPRQRPQYILDNKLGNKGHYKRHNRYE